GGAARRRASLRVRLQRVGTAAAHGPLRAHEAGGGGVGRGYGSGGGDSQALPRLWSRRRWTLRPAGPLAPPAPLLPGGGGRAHRTGSARRDGPLSGDRALSHAGGAGAADVRRPGSRARDLRSAARPDRRGVRPPPAIRAPARLGRVAACAAARLA